MPKDINPDARSLEDAFFAKENAKLLASMRAQAETAARRKALGAAVGTEDAAFLDRLMDLGIGPETALALRLVPLVTVAWADGHMDERERAAVLEAAEKEGVASVDHAAGLLTSWLQHKPDHDLLDLWKQSVHHVSAGLSPENRSEMRRRLLGSARSVAEAAGGFLGLTSKISPAEQEILDELASAFE